MIRRLLKSGSLMSVIAGIVPPLRMIALAPIILSHLSPFELDIYYLLVGSSVFSILLRSRLADVFSAMLSFAHAGADDLSPLGLRKNNTRSDTPNWRQFGIALGSLANVERLIILPIFLVSACIAIISISKINPISLWSANTWMMITLGLFASHIPLMQCHVEAAIRGKGKNFLCYNTAISVSILFIIIGSIVVLLGGGLIGLILCQALVGLLNLVILTMLLKLPDEAKIEYAKFRKMPDKQVLKWAWDPLWKSTMMALSTMGIYRVSSIFIASLGEEGTVASFMFAQSMLLIIGSIAIAPLVSMFPRFSALFVEGHNKVVITSGCARIGLATCLYVIGIFGIGIGAPILMCLINSSVPFPCPSIWYLYSGLYLLVLWIQAWCGIYTRTNDMAFYKRNMISTVCSIIGLSLATYFESIIGVVLAITVPQILILNYYPLSKLAALSGIQAGKIFAISMSPKHILEEFLLFISSNLKKVNDTQKSP